MYSRTGRGLVAAALMAIVLAACRGDGAAVDTTPSTEPPPATATTATTAPPATTTTLPAPTTSTEPENVDPLGWEPVEVAELTRDEQGSGRIGAILSTPSGGWLIGGSVNVDVGMPRPMVWLSDDGTDWEAKELPAPDRGSTIEAGAWNGEAGLFAGRRGSAAGDTLTVLWLVDESGSGEILESVVFPPNMSDLQIEAQPDGGFVLAGWASDRQYVFRSPDGREWTEDTTADEILAGLTYPYIADLAVGELGLLAVVVDERGANDLGVLLIDRGEGFQEAARIEHETDVDLNGAVVTGSQFQVYGAVRNGPGYESTIWTSRDGEEWTSVTPDISIADSHASYNTYGSRFVDAVRSSEGLVGVVFEAASYLFVGSQDGTNWSEIPIGGGIPDTAVPPPDRMAVSGGVVLAASSSIAEPALFRIAEGSATQVVHDALPTPPELVTLPAGASTDDGVVFIVDRQRLAPSLAEEPDLSARAVAVSVDGDVVSSEPMPDLFMSDVVVTEDGVAVVGYERFLDKFLDSGNIDPRMWWGPSVPELTESEVGGEKDRNTKRVVRATAMGSGLVAFGHEFIESGITQPVFWYSPDGRAWEEIPAPDDQIRNTTTERLCPLPGGGAMVVAQHQTESGPAPVVWVTEDGRSWNVTVTGTQAFGSDDQVNFGQCLEGDDRTYVIGAVGARTVAAVWETTDGVAFSPVEAPDLGEGSSWSQGGVGPDGSLYLLGARLVDGASENVLGVVRPDGTQDVYSLEVEALMGPTGPASLTGLLVAGDRLVLFGRLFVDAGIWMAPLP